MSDFRHSLELEQHARDVDSRALHDSINTYVSIDTQLLSFTHISCFEVRLELVEDAVAKLLAGLALDQLNYAKGQVLLRVGNVLQA